MERLLQILKDTHKLSLLTAILFFIGIISSFYVMFTLPNDLIFKGGMTSSSLASGVYAKLFIVIALTFVLGVIAINVTLKAKKEIIVYKEKRSQEESTLANGTASNSTSIDLQTFTNSLKSVKADKILQFGLHTICQMLQAGQGAFYSIKSSNGKNIAEMRSAFAVPVIENESIEFEFGEGLIGQVAASGKAMYLDELPEGYNQAIVSGLGTAAPKYLFIAPIKKENKVIAVIEIATFSPINEIARKQTMEMAEQLVERI